MNNIVANVDFSRETGKIRRELHSSNTAPRLSTRGIYDFTPRYREMHFTASRTHDWALWNPGQRMIDTHFIFPLFKEDPQDPTNYFFDSSDEMIQMCIDAGSRIFYRLGTSIEHSGKRHFNALAPADFEKYAEILAGIVRHYNCGWANGFHHNIEYWEIWNEPDMGPLMWDKTLDDYIRFFVTVFKRLKREFPEIKVGGPALCLWKEDFFEKLCTACTEAGIVPDFVSWHCYTSNARDLIAQPVRAREFMDKHGFAKTELCINEWHYLLTWEGLSASVTPDLYRHSVEGPSGLFSVDSATFNLAVLSGWQETPLDSAFYYGANIDSVWGFRSHDMDMNKNFYSMKMFGTMITQFPTKCFSESRSGTIYTLAGKSADGQRYSLLLTAYQDCGNTIDIEVNGADGRQVEVYALDGTHDFTHYHDFYRHGNVLTIEKPRCASSAYMIVFE